MNIFKRLAMKTRNLLKVYDIVSAIPNRQIEAEQMSQASIMNQYKLMSRLLNPEEMPGFSDVGFKVYSQFDEDGILLYIFSLIGFTNRKIVEVCAGGGKECNAANLIINHGCHGLLFDGDLNNIKKANKFFSQNKSTWLHPPICKHAWITKDNINSLIQENGFEGEIDFFSLDVDGNDYWIWKEISVIRPRVVICETFASAPLDKAVTIPYKEDFDRFSPDNYSRYFLSASPLAMKKLADEKGYRLFGAHKYGFNLIFLRNDVGNDVFPTIELSSIPLNPYLQKLREERWPLVENGPWVNV